MDKISSLLEESSESSLDPFTSSKDFSKIESGVVPDIPKSRGLAETSVSRTSGFYSIQKLPKKERPLSATDVKPVPEDKNETPRYRKVSGTYSLVHKDKPIRRERVLSKSTEAISPQVSKVSQTDQASLLESKPGTSKVEGSYQIVKSRTQKVRTEEVSLTTDVSAPRPKRGLKDRIQKMLGQSKTDIETSGDAWFGDKPEGDDYWTVVDDSQRDDRSILTLLFVFAFLTLVTGVLLWLLLG